MEPGCGAASSDRVRLEWSERKWEEEPNYAEVWVEYGVGGRLTKNASRCLSGRELLFGRNNLEPSRRSS